MQKINNTTDVTIPEKSNLLNVVAIGQALTDPVQLDGFHPFIIEMNPDGAMIKSLESLRINPATPTARVEVYDVESFIDYIGRYRHPANNRLIITATITETDASFEAYLDYIHTESAQAERGKHSIKYVCRRTPEWTRWLTSNKQAMGQIEFAQFIEDNAPDFVNPTSAAMQEIALSLEAKTEGEFASASRLENGAMRFRYNQNITAKAGVDGNVDIPTLFEIGIAPFVGFVPWKMEARLRYRIPNGTLKFWYELVRPHKVIETAAKEIINKITAGTGMIPLLGGVQQIG